MSFTWRVFGVLAVFSATSCVGGPVSDLPATGSDGDGDDGNTGGLDAGTSGRIDAGVPTGAGNSDAGVVCDDAGMGGDGN
ncbi:MAG: hypothetical protein ABW252_26110 [Polyangiales bacterium]